MLGVMLRLLVELTVNHFGSASPDPLGDQRQGARPTVAKKAHRMAKLTLSWCLAPADSGPWSVTGGHGVRSG